MRNLIVEFNGQKHIVNATAVDVYERPMPIRIYSGSSQVELIEVLGWFEINPPKPMEVVPAKNSEVYYNSVRHLD
jgi:hypothetical protein